MSSWTGSLLDDQYNPSSKGILSLSMTLLSTYYQSPGSPGEGITHTWKEKGIWSVNTMLPMVLGPPLLSSVTARTCDRSITNQECGD